MSSTKDREGEEHQAFLPPTHADDPLPRKRVWRNPTQYLRLALECAMALAIVGLLFRPPAALCNRGGRPTPIPQCEYTHVQVGH